MTDECWLCSEQFKTGDPVGFCNEFDTFYHEKCVDTICVTSATAKLQSRHKDCPVCAVEMGS